MAFQNFYDLDMYKACRKFRKEISKLVDSHFPEIEKYELSKQLRRSARSVTAQIAEGHGRFHYQENIQFLRIGRGSLSESLEHLITAFDEGYIPESELERMKAQYDDCLKLINGFIKYLQSRKQKS